MKTSENDVKYSSFNMEEMDKSRELYFREGNNSSRFEGKTVPWEHTIICKWIHVHVYVKYKKPNSLKLTKTQYKMYQIR